MKIYRIDTGPHHGGKRWRYIAADGKFVTRSCETPAKARAEWESGPTPLGADPAISGQNEDQERDAGLFKHGS